MEFSTGRLEASTRIEERSSGPSAEEQRRRAPRRRRENPLASTEEELLTLTVGEDELIAEDGLPADDDRASHQLDDIA